VLVAEAVGQVLARMGPKMVFGLIGSGNFHVSNAMVAAGSRFVTARHEGGAICMADAYAQVSGELGMCTVHQGPGLTNTVTGLTEAAKSRTPLVLVAADTAAAAVRSNFRIAQNQLVEAVGALAVRIDNPNTAVADATRAVQTAWQQRRPVVVMLPLDVQAMECTEAVSLPTQPQQMPKTRPADAGIQQAVHLLARAQRPLVLAGRGAKVATAREAIESLGDILGALLATSAVANGLFANNPWALGISGGFASPTAAELIGEADVVLGVGIALNMWTTRHSKLLGATATVIQVDDDADMLGAHHRIDLGLVGDAAETVQAISKELERRGYEGAGWRSPELAERIRDGAWQSTPYPDAGDGSRIDPRTLSRALDEVLPTDRTVAIDSGHFMGYPAMYLRVPDERGFVFTQAFQAVGLGLSTAIGAAVARPDRLTVAALGDGGAMIGLADLETVARLGLKMLIVVYNDAAYGAEVHHFGPHGHPLDLVRFPDVDFAALGRAVGLHGCTVRKEADLQAVGEWLRGGASPALVLDAKVVPTVVAEWLEEAFRGH
jgi:thiamine pyrophosphate-dependent acetolactate synthase large subunit-like protein